MVSVIVPVYKVEKFLNRCVDSILAQTYQNLEIILVDDGSPDNCGKMCDEYAEKDPRVKVIHQENSGVSVARNNGVEFASGKYVAFVDADDWVEPWGYEKLRELIELHDADIAEAALRFYRPWKPERLYYQGENTKAVSVYSNAEALERLYFGPELLSDISISPCNKLYRKELFKDLRFMVGYRHEDVELIPQLLFHSRKVVKYDDSFYNYNIHLGADSLTGQKHSIYKTTSELVARRRVFQFFQEHPLPKISEYTAAAYANTMTHAYYVGRQDGTAAGKELAKPIPKAFRELYPLLKNNPSATNKMNLRLFRFSPTLFCIIKSVYKKAQQLRSKK